MKENTALSLKERRQAERLVPLQHHKGKFILSAEGQSETYDISMIQDISPFGICIQSNLLVAQGKRIRLIYEEDGLVLKVTGTVAWNHQTSPVDADRLNKEHYQMGIRLCPAGIEKNVRFFRYIAGVQ